MSRGTLFIVAAPSGGGKTSLVRALVQQLQSIEVSISYTTRPPRPAETNGVDYFFVNETTFKDMIAANEFLEHAHVFGHWYGTSVAQIQQRLEKGVDVVLDIDWQGAQQIKRRFKSAISIFILPPSLEILEQRLQSRQQDGPLVIQQRMERAHAEMSHYHEFDYLVVNEEFSRAAHDLIAIVTSQRLQTPRQVIQQQKLLSLLVGID